MTKKKTPVNSKSDKNTRKHSAGKGDKKRPLSVPYEIFAENWDRAFGKKK